MHEIVGCQTADATDECDQVFRPAAGVAGDLVQRGHHLRDDTGGGSTAINSIIYVIAAS